MRFNPFHNIFETPNYPHARTLRTNLGVKFRDSFNVINGNTRSRHGRERMGLFDYATLFIPAYLNRLEIYLDKQGSGMAPVVWFANLFHRIPRFFLSLTATMLAFPVTLGIHGIARLVDNLSDQNLDDALRTQNQEGQTLLSFIHQHRSILGGHRHSIERLQATYDDKQVEMTLPRFKGGRTDPFIIANTDPHYAALFTHNIGGMRKVSTVGFVNLDTQGSPSVDKVAETIRAGEGLRGVQTTYVLNQNRLYSIDAGGDIKELQLPDESISQIAYHFSSKKIGVYHVDRVFEADWLLVSDLLSTELVTERSALLS
jgi:hypothetical protein